MAGALVLSKRSGSLLTCTLNRPKALNALNTEMIRQLQAVLREVNRDDDCRVLLLTGAGDKAFCAGGDMRAVVSSPRDEARRFFVEEYALNASIAESTKPQVSIWNGIVMGGGAGVSVHGRFRVATEATVFAMPETAIGYFPDVGASKFLGDIPGEVGTYIGLTGCRLNASELLSTGLATHYVPSDRLGRLEAGLLHCDTAEDVDAVLQDLGAGARPDARNHLTEEARRIEACFRLPTVGDILAALRQDLSPWAVATLAALEAASPTSLVASLQLLRNPTVSDLRHCLAREFSLTHLFLGPGSDLPEGIRAMLVDKDKCPKWSPGALGGVDLGQIDRALRFQGLSPADTAVIQALTDGAASTLPRARG